MARISSACLIALISAAPVVAQTSPQVEVVFVQPEKFADVGKPPVSDKVRDQTLAELERHLVREMSGRIAIGQRLSISIIDVDLAGGFEPLQSPALGQVRIYKDVYPPRITLLFRLSGDDGAIVTAGKRSLSDMTYLGNVGNRRDPMRHEKKLLDDWLGREFPAGAVSR